MDLDRLKNWIIQNIRPITYMIGAIVGVLVIAAGVSEFLKHREQKAVETLYTARERVEALPAPARASEGVQILEKVVSDHSGTRAAFEAIIGIADIHADAKNFEEAAKQYARAADKAPDDFAKVMAVYNKAGAEEFAGNCQAAITSYASLEKQKAAKFLAPEALLAQGRCLETIKDYAKASEVYQKIQNEFPGNPYYANAAQVFLEKIRPLMKN